MKTIVINSYTPKVRDYCNTIVVDNEKGVQYIFDSDGTYSVYTSKQQEGAPISYVDTKVAGALSTAKNFADEGDVATLLMANTYTNNKLNDYALVTYVNAQDASTLQAAKDYTDAHSGQGGGVSQQYVDSHDASTLQSAKNYADQVSNAAIGAADQHLAAGDAATLQSAKDYADTQITAANVPVFTMSTTDIGAGQPLAANHFWCVYEENQ